MPKYKGPAEVMTEEEKEYLRWYRRCKKMYFAKHGTRKGSGQWASAQLPEEAMLAVAKYFRIKSRNYYRNNKNTLREKQRQWYKENPDYNKYMMHNRVRKWKSMEPVTYEEWQTRRKNLEKMGKNPNYLGKWGSKSFADKYYKEMEFKDG